LAADPGLGRLGRQMLVPLGLGVLVVAGLALTAQPRELARSLRGFDLRLLEPVLALSIFNYALRYARWEIYLRKLGVTLSWGRSLAVFLVGFVLAVTPGRAGELGKAWLVRELGGGGALRIVSAVLAERVTDALGTIVLAALTAWALPGGPWIAAAGLSAVAAVVVLLTWRRGAEWTFAILRRMPFVGTRVPHLEEMYERLRELLSPGLALLAILMAAVAWTAEGVGFWLIVRDYAPKADLLLSVFNYNAASIAGGLSMLPGGLGAAEGSLAALLHGQGLHAADASSITLIIRAATLWLSVLLGLAALPLVARWLSARRDKLSDGE
jgi:uncharacterized protein (TIRG00374 family)